jgi:hypothetical protein
LDVELTEAAVFGSSPRPNGREGFSLIFRGPMTPVLPQATYRFERAGFDPLDIFIVPVGTDEAGMRYEAVFN